MQEVDLDGVSVAVIGGDQRELELIRHLAEGRAGVKALGFPPIPDCPGVTAASDLDEALAEVDAVIAPMSNTDHQGRVKEVLDPSVSIVLNDAAFRRLRRGTPLFIGMAKPMIRDLAERYGILLVETAEMDDIAILNSIPTAEGAVQLALERLPITLHGAKAVLTGFGRCGLTLGRLLHALGSDVVVVARSSSQLSRAEEMGLKTAHVSHLKQMVAEADVVFNTVPALLLTRAVLAEMRRDTLIIDIASAPGGTDFAAAKELGIEAVLALGLPGKVAPKSAGLILARCIPRMIQDLLPNHFQPTSESM